MGVALKTPDVCILLVFLFVLTSGSMELVSGYCAIGVKHGIIVSASMT